MQAQRTWTEAQKATQALRRDRGFGHVQPSKGSGCFICGGPHGYRDCPDKNHPSNFSGKGKPHYGFMADYDPYELYYTKGKGKHGVKGKKGKNLHVVDAFATWKSKGKGKSKAKPSCCECLMPRRLSMAWRCNTFFRDACNFISQFWSQAVLWLTAEQQPQQDLKILSRTSFLQSLQLTRELPCPSRSTCVPFPVW